MARKIRITRKTLREDEVRSFWLDSVGWLRANRKPLLIGAASVAVVLFLAHIYRVRVASARADASEEVWQAEIQIQYGLVARTDSEREKYLATAEDVLQRIASRAPNKIASYATYLLGNVAFFRNNYDDAEAFYKEYIEKARGRSDKADGYIALGYTYENKFFWTAQTKDDHVWLNRALESYRRAESLTSGTAQCYLAMLCCARLYELRGNDKQAKELYERIERERQLEPILISPDVIRNPLAADIVEIENRSRMFTFARTAQARRERMEAGQ
ncbi:hypothetical protein FJY63_05015 [Candidatus Sumerlaeota bacterium]|nr:hypothetical protein [Candidatus Sumerlaeota bacterium]